MKFEKVNDPALVNRLFRPTKLQSALMAIHKSEEQVFKVILSDDKYATICSAQASWHNCIKKLSFNTMKARMFGGELYIIKLEENNA